MEESTEKSRYRLFAKITALFEKMNNELKYKSVKIQTNAEYTPEYLDEILSRYKMVCNIDEGKFVYVRGHRKTLHKDIMRNSANIEINSVKIFRLVWQMNISQ